MKITTAEPPAPPTTRVGRGDDDAAAGAGAGAQFLAVLAGVTAQPSHATTPKGGQHDAPAKDAAAPARSATATRPPDATKDARDAQPRAQHDDPTTTPAPASTAAGDATGTTSNANATATAAKPGAGTPAVTADAAPKAPAPTAAAPTAAVPAATTPAASATTPGTPATAIDATATAPNAAGTDASQTTQHALGDATDATDVIAAVADATDVADVTRATGDRRDGTPGTTGTGTPTATNTATAPNATQATPTPNALAAAQPPSPAAGDAHRDATPEQQRTHDTAVSAPAVDVPSPAHDSTSSAQSQPAAHDVTVTNPTVAQAPAAATPQPAATPAQVAAPPAPAAPPNPVATTPVAQLVSVVEPLRDQPDGSYRMTVDLHPADLGRVQVEVKLERGEVSLHLQADHASTSTLLRDALHDLRQRLQSAGLRTGGVVVGNGDLATGGGSGGRFDGDTTRAGRGGDTRPTADVDDVAGIAATTDAQPPTSSDALVDVRV